MPNRPLQSIFHGMTTLPAHDESTLDLTVNGDPRTTPVGTSLAAFLTSLDLDPRLVVVELNRAILRDRDAYGGIGLSEGDVLEIVHFVGGG